MPAAQDIPPGNIYARWFPLVPVLFCLVLPFLMHDLYQSKYVAQHHEGMAEIAMRWNGFAVDLGGNPMMSFGVNVVNAQLSPVYWIGELVGREYRIPAEAAFQILIMLFAMATIVRLSGAALNEAFAIAVLAVSYCWIPFLGAGAISFNAQLGLLWQDAALAALFAFLFFISIGRQRGIWLVWPPVALLFTVIWFAAFLPYLFVFFALTVAFLCCGAMLAVQSRAELIAKLVGSLAIALVLAAVGLPRYILALFTYTPQDYFKTVGYSYFAPLTFKNATLLLTAYHQAQLTVFAFFIFAAIGAFVTLRHGSGWARSVAYAAVGFELIVHAATTVNIVFELIPMTFLYVELMGVPIVAVLAGVGVWAVLCVIGTQLARLLRPHLVA